MRENQDAFGREMFDYFTSRTGFEAVERDDGYLDMSGGPSAYFTDFRKWAPYQRRAMRHVRGRVLDVGCGAGRVALYLQSKGREVVAIDASPLVVEVARQRGVRDARLVPIEKTSSALGRFDTVVMFGNNFGLFGNYEKAKRLLKRFYRMTSSDARIVAETLDPYNTTNPAHTGYHERNRQRGRMGGQVRIRIRYKQFVGAWFDYLFVSKSELADILEGTGWRVETFLDSGGPVYIAVLAKS
jgi:SAM-dependent methyltransferase